MSMGGEGRVGGVGRVGRGGRISGGELAQGESYNHPTSSSRGWIVAPGRTEITVRVVIMLALALHCHWLFWEIKISTN